MAMASLWSCTKDKTSFEESKSGLLKIKFDHIIGAKKLVLNDMSYLNAGNESYTVSTLKYFVSNIVLSNDQGGTYTLPQKESYFLIDASKVDATFPIIEVPEGNYTKLQFTLGIDSATSTLPVAERTGVLDITQNDMYWDLNNGYIFFKMEGKSNTSSHADKNFSYHIGLYGGLNTPTVNNIKTITLDLAPAGAAKVQEGLRSDIHLMVDLSKVFDGVNSIRIADYPTIMLTGPNQEVAQNYAEMFSHDHTHNFEKINPTPSL